MKKKEIINEIMGVPKSLTPWINTFTQIILDVIKEEDSTGWEYEGEVNYTNLKGGKKTDYAHRSQGITIGGDEVMNEITKFNGYSEVSELIKSDMFKNLPLWKPSIIVNIVSIPNEMYDLEEVKIEASVTSALDQKLSNLGKIKVFSKVDFEFDVITPKDINKAKFISELKSTISHELLHIYQKIKQVEGGGSSHYGKEHFLNILTNHPLLTEVELDWWRKFLHLIYLHLSFEINARVTQLYYELKEKGVNTKEEFLKEIKKTHIWEQMKVLEEFNAEEYIKEFKLPSTEIDFLGGGNPLVMLDQMLRGNISLKQLELRGIDISSEEETIKSLVDLWGTTLKIGGEVVKSNFGVDFNMMPLPEKVKKNPLLFFKFFEQRFHKKAEKWKRKLYRIGSLLIQEGNEALQ